MVRLERGLAALLFIGALLHGYGSFLAFPPASPELVWSVGSSGLAILLAALALLRSARADDRPLSLIIFLGLVAWMAIVACYGLVIGNPFDPRVLYHMVVALGLAAFAFKDLNKTAAQ